MGLSDKVQDTTEALKNVEPLVAMVMSILKTPTGWVLVVGWIVWLILNKNLLHLFDFFERGEKKKLTGIDEYVSKPDIADSDILKVVLESRNAYYFKVATGINTEKRLRDALIKLHASSSSEMTWTRIRRAHPYIKLGSGDNITIEISRFDKLTYGYNIVVGCCSMFFSAGIFIYSLYSMKMADGGALGIAGAFLLYLFSLFVLTQNWPMSAAKKIKIELMQLSEKDVLLSESISKKPQISSAVQPTEDVLV